MSMRSTSTPKKSLFDNIIKDLEQEKLKYSITPRKSLSFSIEDKENFRYTPGNSPSYPIERDKTFQLDHLKETYSHSMRPKDHSRRSIDAFRDLGESVHNRSLNAGSIRSERPPLKPAPYLQNNTNKLKMREKLKKLKITKTELTNIIKEIEVEKMKVSEMKHSILGDIRKNYDEYVKKDEIRLKEDMNRCLALINELQELELNTEVKLEKWSASILDDDISSFEETLKRFEGLSFLRPKPINMDLRLVEKEKIEALENEIRIARSDTRELRENSEKYRQLHETSVHLNHVLSQKAEDLGHQVEKLEVLLNDQKNQEDQFKKQESLMELKVRQLEREKGELKEWLARAQETGDYNLKRELEKQKTNHIDELWQINSLVKRIGANLTQEYSVKTIEQENGLSGEQIIQQIRQNLNELGKALEKGLEKERIKAEGAHKEQERLLREEYEKLKQSLGTKIEGEKEELKETLSQNFKKKTDELLKEIWSLKNKVSEMVTADEHQNLKRIIEEKDEQIKIFEEEKKNWPQKLEAELIRKTMEVRRDNLTSMGVLKEKHEKEKTATLDQAKEMYENTIKHLREEIAHLKEENQFLNQELETANKQVFELMKYKTEVVDSLELEKRKLEEKHFGSNEMKSLEYENKIQGIKEEYSKAIRVLEEKLEKARKENEREKYELRETIERLRSEYEGKIEELKNKYQAKVQDYRDKMQALDKFKEGHERTMGEITNNLKHIKNQLTERDGTIANKEKEIHELTSRSRRAKKEELESSSINFKDLSHDKYNDPLVRSSMESSRLRQRKVINQIIQKVSHLGEVLGGQIKTTPGTLRPNTFAQEIKPLCQLGKELEMLTQELDNDFSLSQEQESESMIGEKSFDLMGNEKESGKLSYKMLNMSDQSMVSLHRKNSDTINEELKERPIQQANKESIGIQLEYHDDSIFPPFDHRVCLRCKKNDLTSPNYCKYANIQKLEDLSFQSNRSSLSYKVSKNHIYGTNVRFKSKVENNSQENFTKKGLPVAYISRGVNTIISNNDFLSNDRFSFDKGDFLELLTPKTETRR